MPPDVPSSRARRTSRARQVTAAAQGSIAPEGEQGAVTRTEPKVVPPPLADVIAEIREQHRIRQDHHNAEKRLGNQIGAIERRLKAQGSADNVVALATMGLEEARAVCRRERKKPERRMEELARLLPVFPWVDAIRGAGALGLAQLVGECGAIGDYRGPAALWKRMGVAVVETCASCGVERKGQAAHGPCACGETGPTNRERQRKILGDAALIHRYNPERRAILFNLGEALIKQNRDGKYRLVYLGRKLLEAARPPCGKRYRNGYVCKSKDGSACAAAHVHARARRYMEKLFLADLWAAWRRFKRFGGGADGEAQQSVGSPNGAPAPLDRSGAGA